MPRILQGISYFDITFKIRIKSTTDLVKAIYGSNMNSSTNEADQFDVEIKLKNITIRLYTYFHKVNVVICSAVYSLIISSTIFKTGKNQSVLY